MPIPGCARCGGSGTWTNPNNHDDVRTCFACDGSGNHNARVYRPSKIRSLPAHDPFADSPVAQSQSLGINEVTSLIRNEVSISRESVERWTVSQLESFAKRVEESVLRQVEDTSPIRIELTRNDVALPVLPGLQHPRFATLLRLATARDASGFVPNIWISGPAGSGKTTGARNLAKALEVPFFYNGALSSDFQVLGYKDATGAYHETAFRQAVSQPSVYLFDDIDSCDSNAPLLALNGALANGLITFPDAQIERHPDCICIATANTWGLGATADYVGRARIDAAFLSRFPGRLEWGYDEAFERSMCGNPEWARRVQAVRREAKRLGLKVVIDPRASIAGSAYLAAGFEPSEVAELTYLANLNVEQREALRRVQ